MAQQITGEANTRALDEANRRWLEEQQRRARATSSTTPLDPSTFSPGGLASLVALSKQARTLPSRSLVGPIGELAEPRPSLLALLSLLE